MRALTIVPKKPDSVALTDVPEPPPSDGSLLVRTLAVGVCGTDREMISGAYGEAPADDVRLILGHESVGEVMEAPADSGFARGDLVVGIVRRPDPVPCASCAVGEWDMCRNGRFTERGIKGRHGFMSERHRLEPQFAVQVDRRLGELAVLVEPASIVAKAWGQIDHICRRSRVGPRRVLVTGAGPIGLLAALFGMQRGLEVHVLDRVEEGAKPQLVRALGATYHTSDVERAGAGSDIVVECTGAPVVIAAALRVARPCGMVCLAGLSAGAHDVRVDLGALNQELVLENNVVFGTVNANRAHYEEAARALTAAERPWLERVVSRRVSLNDWRVAVEGGRGDVKNIVVLS